MIHQLILGPIQVNCYIVTDGATTLCIDPGDEAHKIIAALEQQHLQLDAILITHGHFDHVGGAETLYHHYHCPLFATQETISVLADGSLNLSGHAFCSNMTITPVTSQLTIGTYDIDVFHTPGHLAGSCMFYIAKEQALFSGDMLFKESIGRYDFPGSSIQDLIASLNMIQDLDFDATLYPGHGPASTLAYEKTHNRFLMHKY